MQSGSKRQKAIHGIILKNIRTHTHTHRYTYAHTQNISTIPYFKAKKEVLFVRMRLPVMSS